jgi:signal peptidase II
VSHLPDQRRKGRALRPARRIFFLAALLVLVADIATKRVVATTFYPHEVRQVFGDWVRLTYIHNPGAAFGLFPGSRLALIVVSMAAVAVVTAVAWRKRGRLDVLPLGLILGGAVGNLIDRVRLGEVVDFVQIGIPPENYWPVFNVADSAVTVGVAWLAFTLLRSGRTEPVSGMAPEEQIAPVASPGDER